MVLAAISPVAPQPGATMSFCLHKPVYDGFSVAYSAEAALEACADARALPSTSRTDQIEAS